MKHRVDATNCASSFFHTCTCIIIFRWTLWEGEERGGGEKLTDNGCYPYRCSKFDPPLINCYIFRDSEFPAF